MNPEPAIKKESFVDKFRAVVQKVGGLTWTIILVSFAAGLFVWFLSLIHFLNLASLEDRAQGYSVRFMKSYAAADSFDRRIRIVLISETPSSGTAPSGNIDQKHREFFGRLVRAMTQARAKV